MGVWDWIVQFNKEAKAGGDTQRQRLYAVHQEAMKCAETEPERCMTILREGRQLAVSLDEPSWVLFYDHWIMQKMLGAKEHLDDYLAIAVRATVESRKSIYVDVPQRFCVHDDLIRGYQNLGNLNFTEEIEAALEYMEKEVTPDLECALCTLSRRISFERGTDRYDLAEAAAFRKLDLAESKKSDRHIVSAHTELCWLASRRDDFAALQAHARSAEGLAAKQNLKWTEAECIMWLAVAARGQKDETAARRQFRVAAARMGRLKYPHADYYDAWCKFYDLDGNYAKELKIRDREMAENQGKGRLVYEWGIQIARCRLLALLGNLQEPDIAAARALAAHFRRPERYLPALERIIAGDLSS